MPLHSAACGNSAAAVRLLLEAALETAAADDDRMYLPMHRAAECGSAEALRTLLDAGAPGLYWPTIDGRLPLHLAAQTQALPPNQLLLTAYPAAVHEEDNHGQLPLHWAARGGNEAVVRLLLAANPAAALVPENQGRLPLRLALRYRRFDAARALLPASGLGAAQLLNLLAAAPAHSQPQLHLLYTELAALMPLTPEQWQRVPVPCPSLGHALRAVLARSQAEAALLLAHLPPADARRLWTAALSLHRAQRSLQLEVPTALVGRMLALSLADE